MPDIDRVVDVAEVPQKHEYELVDVIDLHPCVGEYVGCTHPQVSFTVFGVTVNAWHRYHAARNVVSHRWEGRCECCNHGLRWAYIAQDENGEYHCFGHRCLAVNSFGTASANKLAYAERIEEKKDKGETKGFHATFNVPQAFWDLPRDDRPSSAQPWKGEARTRSGRSRGCKVWKLTIWGGCFEQCLDNCLELTERLGVNLS